MLFHIYIFIYIFIYILKILYIYLQATYRYVLLANITYWQISYDVFTLNNYKSRECVITSGCVICVQWNNLRFDQWILIMLVPCSSIFREVGFGLYVYLCE